MSNNQIFESSQKLEWNRPTINENNQATEQRMVEKVYENQQCEINLMIFIVYVDDF